MSEMSDLLIGITLMFISIGSVIVWLPRNGKTAWFVGKPFLAPAISNLIVAGLAIGLILIASYFTSIDDATIAGAARRS